MMVVVSDALTHLTSAQWHRLLDIVSADRRLRIIRASTTCHVAWLVRDDDDRTTADEMRTTQPRRDDVCEAAATACLGGET